MKAWCTALGILVAAWTGIASAHDLSCEETFNGEKVLVVSSYPTTIEVTVTITNDHPSETSVATSVTSALFPTDTPLLQTPLSLGVGQSRTVSFYVTVNDQQECEALDATDHLDDDDLINWVLVSWDQGEAECSAKIICEPAVCQ